MGRRMRWSRSWLVLAALVLTAARASAHPVPFSYLDVRLDGSRLDGTLVLHAFDLAHDLQIDRPERLLEETVVRERIASIEAMMGARLRIDVDGRTYPPSWTRWELLPDRQSLRLSFTSALASAPGVVRISASLFPYDPVHQTFVNVYDGSALRSQTMLDRNRGTMEYFSGSQQGVLAIGRRFVGAGIHHILIGPDHLLFLVGLLLLGGSLRRLVLVVSAFTLAHSVTLSLAVLNLVSPPSRVVEPLIALSIVYVGADNLLVKGGRDARPWIAFAFGLMHGFGFASVLREMDLPAQAIGWSLLSFNVGVELGQLAVVAFVASTLAAVARHSQVAGRRVAFAGSLVVMAAGAFWFVQRVLFVGGTL
jgi:hydrogenase/urease accessory protein HupE